MMKRLLITCSVLFFLCVTTAHATDIYFAATAQGLNNGTSCANAFAYNDGTNGWGLSAQQQPGNTLHSCGAFTFATGATPFTFINSGTSGNPITLKFEVGSTWQSPRFATGGAIQGSGVSFVVVDGGGTGSAAGGTFVVGGTLENTLSGSPNATCIGGTCTINQTGFSGTLIQCNNCNNSTVHNLQLLDSFVHAPVAGSGSDVSGGDVAAIAFCSGACGGGGGGSNNVIDNNIIRNSGSAIYYTGNNGATNFTISNNLMFFINTCYNLGQGGGQNNFTFSGWYVFNNDCHDFANWNDCAGATNCGSYNHHHDGLGHAFLTATSQTLSNCYIYNNYVHGDMGHGTGLLYFESYNSSTTTCYIFNNIFAPTAATNGNGFSGVQAESGSGTITLFLYNNTFQGVTATNGTYNEIWMEFANVNETWNNNIVYNAQAGINFNSTSTLPIASDYNLWNTFSSGLAVGNLSYADLPAWHTGTGFDTHGVNAAPNLNSSFVPNVGSPVIAAGTNLTSIGSGQPNPGLGALLFDKAGNARPSSGAWTIGALNSGVVSSCSPLAFGTIPKGTLSGFSTCQVTNGTTSSITLTGYTFSGTNAADFLAFNAYSNTGVWAPSTAWTAGQFIVDSNSNMQTVTTAGTGGTTPPPWGTVIGNATADGATVRWNMIGAYPNGCVGTLAAGASCNVVVAFLPAATAGTAETAILNVNFTGGPATTSVSGTSGSGFVSPNLPTAPTQVNLPLTIVSNSVTPYQASLNQSLLTPTTTYTVCPSGCNFTDAQLQSAINQAASDCATNTSLVQIFNTETIHTSTGFTIGNGTSGCAAGKYLRIETNHPEFLPTDGNRVNHSYAGVMPQIVEDNATGFTFQIAHSFCGLEVRGLGFSNNSSIVTQSNFTFRFSDEAITATAAIPCNIILDQNVFWAGGPTANLSRSGILADGNNIAVINNDIENYQYTSTDNEGILMFCSNGPALISNNTVSVTTENIDFGGNGCAITDGGVSGNPFPVPSNVEIASNYAFKPLRWRSMNCGSVAAPYCGAGFSFIQLSPQPTTSACTSSQCQVNVSFFEASVRPDIHPFDNAQLINCSPAAFNGTYSVLLSPLPTNGANPFTFSVINTNLNSTISPNGTVATGCAIQGFFDPQYLPPADGAFQYDVKNLAEMKEGCFFDWVGNWFATSWQGSQAEMLIFQEANPVLGTANYAPWDKTCHVRVRNNTWVNGDINGYGLDMWTALNPVVSGSGVGSSLGTTGPIEFDNNLVYQLGPEFTFYEELGSHSGPTTPLANAQLQDLFFNHDTIINSSVNPALSTFDIFQFNSPNNLVPGQTPFLRDAVNNSIIDLSQILNGGVSYPYGSQKCQINSGLAVPCLTPAAWAANIPLATVAGTGIPFGCTNANALASFQPNAGPAGVGSSFCPTANLPAIGIPSTTINTGTSPISAGVQTVTPASMANISAPMTLLVGSSTNAEYVSVTAITGTTFTATFANPHNSRITPVYGVTPPSTSIAHNNGTDGLDVGANAAAVVTMTSWVPSGTPPSSGSVTLSPSSNNFGSINIGSSSSNVTFTLSNTTPSTVTGISINNVGGNTADFINTNTGTCTTSLPATFSCTIIMKFTPSIAGAESTTLTVTDSAGTQTSALSGTGISSLLLTFNPTSLGFGSLPLYLPSGISQIQVTNTGGGTVTIVSVAVSGIPFVLQTPPNAPDCRSVSSLVVGASCFVGINAVPATAGLVTGAMILTDNATGSPQSIPLTVTGIPVAPAPNPLFGGMP